MTRAMQREMALAQARLRMRGSRRWIRRYRPNDHARRHRLPDNQPKTQRVISYTRRG
jgi:hypothetical protein